MKISAAMKQRAITVGVTLVVIAGIKFVASRNIPVIGSVAGMAAKFL